MIMYTKLLTAKYSPGNKCFASEGEVLTIVSKPNLPKNDAQYFFIGAKGNEKSQFGWVTEVAPFTIEDFIKNYAKDPSNESEKEYIKIMLDAAAKYGHNTPMAASFVVRGTMQKKVVLTVHKVLFYDC